MTEPRDTPNEATTTRPQQSSQRTAHKSPFGWLPWLLLALLLLLLAGILAAVLLFNDDDDDDSVATPAVSAEASPPVVAAPPPPAPSVPPVGPTTVPEVSPPATDVSPPAGTDVSPPAGGGGTDADLLVGDQGLLGLSGATLTQASGGDVTGSATVQSVVSDSGFWLGPSADERVFVFLTREARGGQEESPFEVQDGQQLSVEGTLQPLSNNADVLNGVTDAEGRALLERQGQYVSATKVDIG